jgi:hypothetical protein
MIVEVVVIVSKMSQLRWVSLRDLGADRCQWSYQLADGMSYQARLAVYAANLANEHGSWKTFSERLVYDNKWVKVGLTDVQAPNGERWEYHVVHLARIALALIVNDQDEALMLWRYRFAKEQWGYELLGGMVDDGEDAAITAAREAAEESGWQPIGEPEHLVSN